MRNVVLVLVGAAVLGVACGDSYSPSLPDAYQWPQCSDGIDNDDDGQVDYPDDLGCTDADDDTEGSLEQPQCDDGRDNDGDGKTDYPADPGCFASLAGSEVDDCPSGPGCPQCANGIDDDGSGATDYPDDPGCTSASDPFEFTENPVACGANLMIKNLPPSGAEQGMLATTSTSDLVPSCGGVVGAPAIAYQVSLTEPKVLVANTIGSAVDTVLSLRSASCEDPKAEIACHDDVSSTIHSSTLTASLAAGHYYLIVSGATANATGAYSLEVAFFTGEGESCAVTEECGPGLVCRTPVGETEMQCAQPVCNDGRDDDGDGVMDYPADPGCASPDDDDETDDCPDGPSCPQCGNDVDDDSDGMTDYPDDPSCPSASGTSESCLTSEDVIELVTPLTAGTTVGATHDFTPSCASSIHAAPDRAYKLQIPAVSALQIDLVFGSWWDSVTALMDSTCGGTPLKCSDSELMSAGARPAGTYYFIVDGWDTDTGPYDIRVSGTIVDGESCESALAQTGALTCGPGHTCQGAVGARSCQPAACNNGTDDDGDTKADFPADPGCTSTSDDDETDDCPSGPSCPACANGIDDDGDGLIDYPEDPGCTAASRDTEECAAEQDPLVTLTMETTPGNLSGASADITVSCGSTSSPGPNLVYMLEVPAMRSLTIDTEQGDLDTAIALLPASCIGPEIACNDDGFGGFAEPSRLALTNVAAGTYALSVNAFSAFTTTGPFAVRVRGVIENGESCEVPLAASGALTCGPGYACSGAAGSRTCQPASCSNGADDDGDGKTDYPFDPGCESPSDDDEADPATAPVCSNGMDDDTDTLVDYPNDFGCASAAGTSEEFCAPESDPTSLVTSSPIMDTTVGATHDFTSSECYFDPNSADRAYALQLPVPVTTLRVSAAGSLDYIISVRDVACGAEHACADNGLAGTTETIMMTNVPAGGYAVVVDTWSSGGTATGPFTLTVQGTVAAGTSCDSPLFGSGVLACPTGTTCSGTPAVCQ